MSLTEKRPNLSLAIWLLIIFVVGGIVVAYNYSVFRSEMMVDNRNIPPIKEMMPFSLLDEQGNRITNEDMKGSVWLANFIFTRCPGPCQTLTNRMKEWQTVTGDMEDVQMLSFTVDPEYDTPEVLERYAKGNGANPDHWRFVTGDPEQMMTVIRKGFMLVATEQPDPALIETEGLFIHSTRVALVDKQGLIRAYYDTESPEAMEKLAGDIEHLRAYKTP